MNKFLQNSLFFFWANVYFYAKFHIYLKWDNEYWFFLFFYAKLGHKPLKAIKIEAVKTKNPKLKGK
jgi:hypothetical protein